MLRKLPGKNAVEL